ncbi:MAG: histidine phosphatase family protein [Alphaproteobacteria bacterium]|nr:histidine phosphatase family protein [Alphaproteobacteria bacterium]
MTKTLLLLRHAKSDQTGSVLDDFDRPLNARGRDAAPKMGAFLRASGLVPELVLCSAAARAVETWTLARVALAGAGADSIPAKQLRSLYLASPSRILDVLHRTPDAVGCVLVIGHNPGIARLALRLPGADAKPKALRRLKGKYPTAGLTELCFESKRWGDVVPGVGRLVRFVAPKDL